MAPALAWFLPLLAALGVASAAGGPSSPAQGSWPPGADALASSFASRSRSRSPTPMSPLGWFPSSDAGSVSMSESLALREEVREAFTFTYDAYMRHAFPRDELAPLSCRGKDTLGAYALTLVDAMDTLVVMGNVSEFAKAVQWVASPENLVWDALNETVSLFETNIRIMGGLLAAHTLAEDLKTSDRVRNAEAEAGAGWEEIENYDGSILKKAEDLGHRLMRAFEDPGRNASRTATGIPFGSVHLHHGVNTTETEIANTAAATTLVVEMGTLSRLTGNATFLDLAKQAVHGVWSRKSNRTGLVGSHINISSGQWTHPDAGIGTGIDSYYEYLIKGSILLGIDDGDFDGKFHQAYAAAEENLRFGPWYVDINMDTGSLVWPVFNSLQAFWPGMQTMVAACKQDHEDMQANATTRNAPSLIPSRGGDHAGDGEANVDQHSRQRPDASSIGGERLASIHSGYGCISINSAGAVNGTNSTDVNATSSEENFAASPPSSLAMSSDAHDLQKAIDTHAAMFSVWRKYGATPEGYALPIAQPKHGQRSYPLRPELIESTYYLYLATRDATYLSVGRDIFKSLQVNCRSDQCGYAALSDVRVGTKDDTMESFFLAETLKYLFLLFDAGAGDARDHRVVRMLPHRDYVFSTEGHLLPITDTISNLRRKRDGDGESTSIAVQESIDSDDAVHAPTGDESGDGDAVKGYCRPLHPIWDAPRYREHILPDPDPAEVMYERLEEQQAARWDAIHVSASKKNSQAVGSPAGKEQASQMLASVWEKLSKIASRLSKAPEVKSASEGDAFELKLESAADPPSVEMAREGHAAPDAKRTPGLQSLEDPPQIQKVKVSKAKPKQIHKTQTKPSEDTKVEL